MGLLIASIVVFVLALAFGIGMGIYYERDGSHAGWFWLFFILISPAMLLFGAFTKVSANEVGIIYDDRYGVMEEVKLEGFQSKSIFEHITPISTSVKTVTLGDIDPNDAEEAELMLAGQTINSIYAYFIVTISYRIEATNAGKFFKITGSADLTSVQLNAIVKQALQATTIEYDVYDLLAGELENARAEFETRLAEILSSEYYVTLAMATFDDIDAGNDIEASIQQKAQAQQNVEIAIAQQQKATIENATLLMNQQAIADAAVIEAQGVADAVQIAADAEAYKVAAEKQAVADLYAYYAAELPDLTDAEIAELVNTIIYYATWDGVLPKVVGDATVFIPLE